MGNNINKNSDKLPQIYSFLGDGQIVYQKVKYKNNQEQERKIVKIQKVITSHEFQEYKNSLKNLKNMKEFKTRTFNNLLLPLEQSFNQEIRKSLCSQNKICTLKYQFTSLQNTLEAQFLRRKSESIYQEKTRDIRTRRKQSNYNLDMKNSFHIQQGYKKQSFFQQEELLSYFQTMVKCAELFHKWTNKSGNYKLNQIFIQADTLQLQIANYLTFPSFQSIYHKYLADPIKIKNHHKNQDLQYLAPQEWIYLKQGAQVKTCNKKSEVFIIGKNILKLMCLSNLDNLYDKNYLNPNLKIMPHKTYFGKVYKKDKLPEWYFNQIQRFYNEKVIQSYISQAANIYSKKFVDLIKKTLDVNYFKRPSAQQIIEILKSFQQKSQISIYQKLLPAMISIRESKDLSNQKQCLQAQTQRYSHKRRNTKTSSGQIISLGKNSARKKQNEKLICQSSQRQQFGCIPFQINAQIVFSEYISFKQSARQSDFA